MHDAWWIMWMGAVIDVRGGWGVGTHTLCIPLSIPGAWQRLGLWFLRRFGDLRDAPGHGGEQKEEHEEERSHAIHVRGTMNSG